MFTGLIQQLGTVVRATPGAMTRLTIECGFDPKDYLLGESIACDGCCLTVVEHTSNSFTVDASPETLRRTTLGTWKPGSQVNLEKAMRLGDRLGGHMVAGHVDAVAQIVEARPEGGSWILGVSLPRELAPFFVEKGSVTVNGVSLTVNELHDDRFLLALIPETVARTNLKGRALGDRVNLEADLFGKYVARLQGLRQGLTEAELKAKGF